MKDVYAIYEPNAEGRERSRGAFRPRNPTRWMKRTIVRISGVVGAAGHKLAQATITLRATMPDAALIEPPFFLEVVAIWVRQLVLTAIEVGVGWLLKKLTRPKPARLIRLHPAT
jgi:hypothetical protein